MKKILCLIFFVLYVPVDAAQVDLPPKELDSTLKTLKQLGIPADHLSFVVARPTLPMQPILTWNPDSMRQVASTMKIITSGMALDLLGPAFRWKTPIWFDGTIEHGVLTGSMYIKAQGDPDLQTERLYDLLSQIKSAGVHTIHGNIVIDRSVFDIPYQNPADFDHAPLEVYNVRPDALMINGNAITFSFIPTDNRDIVHVGMTPPLWGVKYEGSLNFERPVCDNFLASLVPQFDNPKNLNISGSDCHANKWQVSEQEQPGRVRKCKEDSPCLTQTWMLAYPKPEDFAPLAIAGMWHEIGGTIIGTVKDGIIPKSAANTSPVIWFSSPTLTQMLYKMNKESNNQMAMQLFLTLGRLDSNLQLTQTATWSSAQKIALDWWSKKFPSTTPPTFDNGSGLSRVSKASAMDLADMLNYSFNNDYMPELMSSLPILGIDGTLENVKTPYKGAAHMKTGTLKNVVALAGYVRKPNDGWYIVVGIINDDKALQARQALQNVLTQLLK